MFSTHNSGGDWPKIEAAFKAILDGRVGVRHLSPLARTIVDLLSADRGITGRMMKRYFQALLASQLDPGLAAHFRCRVRTLFEDLEARTIELTAQPEAKPAGAAKDNAGYA
jgi:hypothetical protein